MNKFIASDFTNSEPDRFARVLSEFDAHSFDDVGFVKRLKIENQARLKGASVFDFANEAEQQRLREDHSLKLKGHTERRLRMQMKQSASVPVLP